MQFQKKTSIGRSFNFVKLLIKISVIFFLLFILLIFVNKIEFPSPNKKLQITIPNEDLRIVK